jgi:hypothetical protein
MSHVALDANTQGVYEAWDKPPLLRVATSPAGHVPDGEVHLGTILQGPLHFQLKVKSDACKMYKM